MSINKIFKQEILSSGGYQGGKSIEDVGNSNQRIFKLSSNENFFGSSPLALSALQKSCTHLNYYPSGTPIPLYRALYELYKGELELDNFIATNSGSGLIEMCTRAFLGPSTNCILSNPCFSPYQMFSSWTGANVIDIPLAGESFHLDVEGILRAITDQTRIIFLTSPNNPTGSYIRRAALERLLDGLPDNIVVLYDEVYHHFATADDYCIAVPYVKAGYPIIAINSFSKAYGLAGLRVGYGYSTTEIIGYLRKVLRPFLINDLSMHAAIAALKDQEFIEYTVSQITEQRAQLMSGLEKLGIKYWPSEGNFVLIKTHLDEHDLTSKMLEQNIMVRPTGNFGARDCIRITIGDDSATKATLSALASILNP